MDSAGTGPLKPPPIILSPVVAGPLGADAEDAGDSRVVLPIGPTALSMQKDQPSGNSFEPLEV